MAESQVNEVALKYMVDDDSVKQTNRYKPYPEYKDSGVEWVGEIPSAWKVEPVFSVFDSTTEKNIDGKESNVLSLSYGNIIRRDVEKNFGLLPESFNTYQIVNTGDIILRLTDLQNDKRSLRVGLAKEKGIITSAYLKLYTKQGLNPRFAYRLLHSYDTTKVFYGLGGGLRQSMKFEDFRRLPILVPPLKEQEQIANFLDYETTKIDTFIEKQQRLIELLTEKRQAVISHAVTKGLNPDVPMKDSGVEWLGEVPAHWDIPKLIQQTSRIGDGLHSTPKYQDNTGYYFVNGNNLVDGHIHIGESAKEVPEDEYIKHFIPLDESSVLLSINGTIGNVARYRGETVILGKSASYMNCNNHLAPEYLILYLQTSQAHHYFDLEVTGTTIYNLSLNSLRQMKVCIPPTSEQLDIHNYCQTQKKKYDSLIYKAQQAIKLMQERRTALISSAVTGKIDVRDWEGIDPMNEKSNIREQL